MEKATNQAVVRLDPKMLARIDRIVVRLNKKGGKTAVLAGPRGVTRSTVIRMLLDHALPAFEGES